MNVLSVRVAMTSHISVEVTHDDFVAEFRAGYAKKASEIRIGFDLDIRWSIDKNNKEVGRITFPYRAIKVFGSHGFIFLRGFRRVQYFGFELVVNIK